MCKKQCGAMTHQETTDRINALARALDGLSPLRTIIHRGSSDTGKDPVNKAIDNIATELSKLISPSDECAPQAPKAPTPPEARTIIENGKPQD